MYEEENSLKPIVQGDTSKVRSDIHKILKSYKYGDHPVISQDLYDYLSALVSLVNAMIRDIVENEDEGFLIGKRKECVAVLKKYTVSCDQLHEKLLEIESALNEYVDFETQESTDLWQSRFDKASADFNDVFMKLKCLVWQSDEDAASDKETSERTKDL